MGDSMTSDASRTFYGSELVDNSAQLLERHYHHLTRIIRPQNFFSWLRHRGVFSLNDQEEVERKYITTCLRAGHLVDIIMTKGKAGFVAFMEVVEYEYPELFTAITDGKQPREPPDDFYQSPERALSSSKFRSRMQSSTKYIEVITQIGRITKKLNNELAEKNERFIQLQQLLERIQSEKNQEMEYREAMEKELQNSNETIEELNAQKGRLQNELAKIKTERDELFIQCAQIRTQKDSYMDECNRLRLNCDRMGCQVTQLNGEIQRTRSCRPAHELQQLDNYRRRLLQLEQQLKAQNKGTAEAENVSDDIVSLKLELSEWEKKEQSWLAERTSLTHKLNELERQCQSSQETSNKCLMSLEQVKGERDQILKQQQDLSAKYEEERSKNERLDTECRGYLEKFRRMEETMENLYREIDQAKLMRPSRQRIYEPRAVCVYAPPTSFDTDHGEESEHDRREEITVTPKTYVTSCSSHAALPSRDVIRLRRNASYTEGTSPIIVFSPPDIHDRLLHCLQSYYSCPYVNDSDQTIPSSEIIHEIPPTDGSSSSMKLTLSNLKELMKEVTRPACLLSVPVDCVKRLVTSGITIVAVVIKYRTADGCSEVTEDEENLMVVCTGSNRYVLMEIDVSLSANIPALASRIRDILDSERLK